MSEQSIWSVGLGRWAGLRVRLHMFFLLFIVFTLFLCSKTKDLDVGWTGPALLIVLFFSVLAHELAHVLTATRLGEELDEIVLGPIGGLGRTPTILEPPAILIFAVAGPIMNLAIVVTAAIALSVRNEQEILTAFSIFSPDILGQTAGNIDISTRLVDVGLRMVVWVNWSLVVINLVPAFPFDGGLLVRALLQTCWPQMETRVAVDRTAWLAKAIAGLLLVAAIYLAPKDGDPANIPLWLPLLLLSIFVFFSAKKEETRPMPVANEDSFLGYDFSEGFTSLERTSKPCSTKPETEQGAIASWLKKRREQNAKRRKELEASEDSKVDEILAKVYSGGIDSLCSEDRALLNRVSRRYKERRTS